MSRLLTAVRDLLYPFNPSSCTLTVRDSTSPSLLVLVDFAVGSVIGPGIVELLVGKLTSGIFSVELTLRR